MRKERDAKTVSFSLKGYVVTEAAVLLPLASVLILLLVYLCSYIYQSCYLVQTSYIAAFRGSRQKVCREEFVNAQLDELLSGQVLSFQEELREIHVDLLSVSVSLERETPFAPSEDGATTAKASWRILKRDPVTYIRGLRRGEELIEENE
ncbi:MAG: hypothetical protein IJ390_08735 [Lachnospiraceae bacterium]|nr:hypothetical protein [Lachnospiraceae bacterium]